MSRLAEYYDFQQMLYLLSTRALEIMLDYESDTFRHSLIKKEIEARK